MISLSFKFVHAADLHLGCVFSGLQSLPDEMHDRVINASLQALINLIDLCIAHNVSFLLLCGDIFETQTPSLRLQKIFCDHITRLANHQIAVYLVTGNHDAHVFDNFVFPVPVNLHIFSHETVETIPVKIADQQIYISGMSYQAQDSPDLSQAYPTSGVNQINIGLLHCEVGGTPESRYAPVSLSQLQSKNFTYFALGHVHSNYSWGQSSLVQYSGVLQGRHRLEKKPKGCYVVECFGPHNVAAEFIPCQDVIWDTYTLDLSNITADQLASSLEHIKETVRALDGSGTFLTIVLTGAIDYYHMLQRPSEIDDLLADLRFRESQGEFVWVVELDNRTTPEIDWDEVYASTDFVGDVINALNNLAASPEIDQLSDIQLDQIVVDHDLDLDYQQIIEDAKLIAYYLLRGDLV